jgi:hypothetical protein
LSGRTRNDQDEYDASYHSENAGFHFSSGSRLGYDDTTPVLKLATIKCLLWVRKLLGPGVIPALPAAADIVSQTHKSDPDSRSPLTQNRQSPQAHLGLLADRME